MFKLLMTVVVASSLVLSSPLIGQCAELFYDDFETDLANWTIGGRRLAGPNIADIVQRNSSKVGHLYKFSFSEITLEREFPYGNSLLFEFDFEVSASSSGGAPDNYFGIAAVQFIFRDDQDQALGTVAYGTATTPFPFNASTHEIPEGVMSHHVFSMPSLLSQITIDQSRIDNVLVRFVTYSSTYPAPSVTAELWIDNFRASTTESQFVIELPGDEASGINGVGGWKCPQTGPITIAFDDEAPRVAAGGLPRADTATVCNNDGRNGFLTVLNYALLGAGEHTVKFFDAGIKFAEKTFSVGTLGAGLVPFAPGLSGEFSLPAFPTSGKRTVVKWREELQGFVVLRVENDD